MPPYTSKEVCAKHALSTSCTLKTLYERALGFVAYLSRALVVPRKHASHHHEVGSCSKRLCHVARTRAPPVRDDAAAEPVGGVCALDHGRELGVADARLLPGGAHGARADAHLCRVQTAKSELRGIG